MLGYNEKELTACEVRETTRQRLQRQKERIEKQLSNINEAIEALDKNPEVERIIDLLAKV